MKTLKVITSLLFIALMAIAIAGLFNFNALYVGIVLIAASFLMPKNVAFMAVQREVWEKDIVGNLFKNNEFAKRAFNADVYVLQGAVVHIPVAGTPSAVQKNASAFPLVVTSRADNDITYPLDTFNTAPRRIARIDQYELAYDKRQSVLGEDQAVLIQTAMDSLLYRWAPLAANVIETAGPVTAATIDGGTGNRLAFTKVVFGGIKLKMDKANIPSAGRVGLLTADHYQQLLDSFSDIEKTNFHQLADFANGIIGRYLGIDIMMRSTVTRYRKVAGVWTSVDELADGFGASDQTGDSAASIFYYEQAVERALGTVEMFERINDPLYLGDVYNFLLRLGGRIRRSQAVFAVVEAISA